MTKPIRSIAHTRFAAVRSRLEAFAPRPGWRAWLYEFLLFGFKQGWACLFGALMLGLLFGTHLLYPREAALARYDFLTLAALAIQAAMFKTSAGSWIYPEPNLLRIGGVPLFSGFMYAAVGSYIARVWRIFDFRFSRYPSEPLSCLLAVAIYINFFAHHWLPDVRLLLFAAMALLFRRTRVWFRVWRADRWMPLLVGFFLVALFIWFAENIATFSRAWIYPSQQHGWALVSPSKLGAWFLLMYISFILVAAVHCPQEREPVTTLDQDDS